MCLFCKEGYRLRIHGDNILECERALELIASSIGAKIQFRDSPIYVPIYILSIGDKIIAEVQLFPGYNRWGVDIQDLLSWHGAPVHEAADAIITKISDKQEEILFSIEFCNALPAGNNAWQRTGRAIASASVNMPYLHVSEIGGVELNDKRQLKSHRFPNPIIPFSYIILSKNYNTLALPVYLPSPSSPKEIRDNFKDTFGINDCKTLIKGLIFDEDISDAIRHLISKNMQLISLLTNKRKRKDTLQKSDWTELLNFDSSDARLNWLEKYNKLWSKKRSKKVLVNSSFLSLLKQGAYISIGAGDIPICLVPRKSRINFAKDLSKIYGKSLDQKFIDWISLNSFPLVIVWITGFKPGGEDSRPDRGLVPLARMLLGPDVPILSIISGPAKKGMWKMLETNPTKLSQDNGLWESILNLSDAILVDSTTYSKSPLSLFTSRNRKIFRGKILFPPAQPLPKFSEQDVDSIIHFLFARFPTSNIFEAMCNPPGGDWSGLSFIDSISGTLYRWTSLPRVSKNDGKRPDHIIELITNKALFSIESKDFSSNLESKIGPRLNQYTEDIIKTMPNIKKLNDEWVLVIKGYKPKQKIDYYSAGAFCFRSKDDLQKILADKGLDILFALEFNNSTGVVKIHIASVNTNNPLILALQNIASQLNNRLEIKIY